MMATKGAKSMARMVRGGRALAMRFAAVRRRDLLSEVDRW
jgi:hypothetical protein